MAAELEMEVMTEETEETERKRFSPKLIAAVVIVIALAVAGGFVVVSKRSAAASNDPAAADGKKDEKEKTPVPVEVAAATTGPISAYVSSTANLVAEQEVNVLTEAEGRVARLLVDEGDRVARGQILAWISNDDSEIGLEKARVRAANANAAYARSKDLWEKKLISQTDYDKTAMEKGVADQELAEARVRVSKLAVRSPFSGLVTQRKVKLGQHVRPPEELFTVTDLDPLIARVYLPEKDLVGLTVGRDVRITLRADDRVRFNGRIREISPVVDVATGTVKVTVEAVNPPANVRPGSFVTIDIVRETREGTLIPKQAVLRELQNAHVFIEEDGKAVRRSVTLGLEEGAMIQVLDGIEPGERIIVTGQGALKDGSLVKTPETVTAG